MIDNIRFNFRFKPKEDWLVKQKINLSLKEEWSNGKGKGFTGKLFLKDNKDDDDDDDTEKVKARKSKPYLLIQIKLIGDKEVRVFVLNSLRKWYFDKEVIGDFNKTEFNKCLNLISEKLEVPKDILLGAKVTRVEYGANLRFREEYRCFYACIHSHYDIKKKCNWGNETIEFKGENRSVIFYDKVTEQKGKTFSAKNQKKINNVALLLRYEIKVNKISGSPEKPFMSYLNDIIQNWDLIADLWCKELDKITFVNDINPKVYSYLKGAKIKPIKEYLIYLGMKQLGLDNLEEIMQDRIYARIKKSTMDSLIKTYEEFNSMIQEEDFEKLFRIKVQEKVEKLKA